MFVTIVASFNTGPYQTKLLMPSTHSATPKDRSNPMSLMVWMCNWTLKLKVTMFVIILKFKAPWVRIC